MLISSGFFLFQYLICWFLCEFLDGLGFHITLSSSSYVLISTIRILLFMVSSSISCIKLFHYELVIATTTLVLFGIWMTFIVASFSISRPSPHHISSQNHVLLPSVIRWVIIFFAYWRWFKIDLHTHEQSAGLFMDHRNFPLSWFSWIHLTQHVSPTCYILKIRP